MNPCPDLSIVAPMYNEEANVASTVARIKDAMKGFAGTWEFLMVNDGSTDGTWEAARKLAEGNANVRVTGYPKNAGRGKALRTGFAEARGRIVATVDFDLSYSPDHILRMYDYLSANPDVDIVLASAYMPGGRTAGVPMGRLLASVTGNIILRHAFGGGLHTLTCVVRAYRREALEALDLTSDGKELHLEIVSKAHALGFKIAEIPATLTGRKKGRAKFKLRSTTASHMVWAFRERPAMFLAWPGAGLLALAAIDAIALLWKGHAWTPAVRGPLVTALVLLIVVGVQLVAFGLVGSLIVEQRRTLLRLESRARMVAERLGRSERGGK